MRVWDTLKESLTFCMTLLPCKVSSWQLINSVLNSLVTSLFHASISTWIIRCLVCLLYGFSVCPLVMAAAAGGMNKTKKVLRKGIFVKKKTASTLCLDSFQLIVLTYVASIARYACKIAYLSSLWRLLPQSSCEDVEHSAVTVCTERNQGM